MSFWVLNILVFVTAFLLIIAVYNIITNRRTSVGQRLLEVQKITDDSVVDEQDELQRPFSERLIRPAIMKLGETLGNLTPRSIRDNIEKKIIYAGNPYNMNLNRFVALQAVLAIVLFIFAVVVLAFLSFESERIFILCILFAILGFMLPIIFINSSAAKRQLEIQKALPDMLDLLLVSVEAGLGFDMALKRVAEQAPGSLSKELTRALEEIRLGKTREEALRGIVKRTGVSDLSTFISSIIQAEQLGTNIANTLRVQAATMRQKRRQRAEEAAMKAPIKMLFPLIFFIFPTLFLVILGPTLIRIMGFFSSF